MSFQAIFAKEADEDLKETALWIAQYSPDKAAHWYFSVTEAIASLEISPARCSLASESKRFGGEIRQLLFGKHRTLFLIQDKTVHVLRVRHQAQRVLVPDELLLREDWKN